MKTLLKVKGSARHDNLHKIFISLMDFSQGKSAMCANDFFQGEVIRDLHGNRLA